MNSILIDEFGKNFGKKAQYLVLSPGRVNLIGEHIDYHQGKVLPCAISLKNTFAGSIGKDYIVDGYNLNSGRKYSVNIQDSCLFEKGATEIYIYGVCRAIIDSGYFIKGFSFVIGGDLPMGSGLSSSASFSCGLIELISQMYHLNIQKRDIARIARLAENKYAGVPCGIMDQMAIVFGKEKRLVRIDCRSLDVDYCSMPGCISIVVVNTMIKRQLAKSEYEKRQIECAELLKAIENKYSSVKVLRDVNYDMLNSVKGEVSNLAFKRGKYVLDEMKRVDMVFDSMNKGDIESIGRLFYEGHRGLKDEYEVSCEELDLIVEETYKFNGAIASRMTGAGFGGCAISLVKKGYEKEYADFIMKKYYDRFGKKCEVYDVGEPQEGLSSMKL